MKTVIVTGCSGQLGKEICTQLTNLSLSVVGVDINDDILSLKLNNFTFTKLDITSENEVLSFYNNFISASMKRPKLFWSPFFYSCTRFLHRLLMLMCL